MNKIDINYVSMGQRIKKIRQENDMTQEDCAYLAGISASFFGHIERGSRKASLETLANISLALNSDVHYLIFGATFAANADSKLDQIIQLLIEERASRQTSE